MYALFSLYRKLRRSEASQLLINLSFALLGLYVTFMFAAQGSSRLSVPFCGIIGVLLHYFFLVVFFVMAAEAVDLFIKLVIVLGSRITHFITKASVAAWSEFHFMHARFRFYSFSLSASLPPSLPLPSHTYSSTIVHSSIHICPSLFILHQ